MSFGVYVHQASIVIIMCVNCCRLCLLVDSSLVIVYRVIYIVIAWVSIDILVVAYFLGLKLLKIKGLEGVLRLF